MKNRIRVSAAVKGLNRAFDDTVMKFGTNVFKTLQNNSRGSAVVPPPAKAPFWGFKPPKFGFCKISLDWRVVSEKISCEGCSS